ncbi:MAG: SsrA-binding protein SmpB [Alphaproteobacteria bacterium]|nr:MAG: SsrA-binding protein SmpB [Alphaproteobacteria bacterium]
MAAPRKKDKDFKGKVIAVNRKARHEYFITDTLEAGIMLEGSEVKSLRGGETTVGDSYAEIVEGEMFLVNAYIPQYKQAGQFNHETKRPRKLLLHKKQIERLGGLIKRGGMTIVPLQLYFNEKGRAKVELGIAKGKKLHDKRQTEKSRDWNRQKARLMREKG